MRGFSGGKLLVAKEVIYEVARQQQPSTYQLTLGIVSSQLVAILTDNIDYNLVL